MGMIKFGASIAITVSALGFAGIAHADFVKTVSTEAECTSQDGSVMDLNGVKHCLVPVISPEFQKIEYAGELLGVTTCAEKDTRKTQIGDFCLIALEKKPTAMIIVQDATTELDNSEAEMAGRKKAKKSLLKAVDDK